MRKLVTIALLGISVFSCKRPETKTQEACGIVKTFNINASDTFKKKYLGSHDLDIMDKRERCIMEKTIANYLDHSNNWSTSVIDSFYVRSYGFSDFIDMFSFVSNSQGELYFIYSPEFSDRFLNSDKYYTKVKSGMLKLNDSSDYVVKFDMTLLNNFLDKEVTHSKSFTDQVIQSQRLLPSLLPHLLSDKAHASDLTDSLSKRPMAQANKVMEVLEPVIPAKDLTLGMSSTTRSIYRNAFGFVVVHFKESERSNKLELDFYFIPDQYSYRHLRDSEPLFAECNQL